ncbi:MAG: phosphate signaling complex protein PhoU [Lachnospiraceae bacterium]|uniref:phosphate signaling complex protein PhoU n=1 Tax=Parablautia sp. Marseille-Q6255 TaxID=3039593 RepID=UPI0024BD1382|nr:phosphate signaling complex protein PhoU [Parablautia sp. Marseille-Q6255]
MRERYIEQLEQLQREVLELGMLCEKAIMKTCCLLKSSENRSQQVKEISALEKDIDTKEHAVEAICIQLLLRQQPIASDLRRISAALKLVTDMERIGDQATDIAEILQTGSVDVPVQGVRIAQMAEFTMQMVNKSVESYVNRDLVLAQEVIESDDTLDQMFLEVRRTLNENIPQFTADQILDLLMIAKYYERIGDHATNIAEWVEFSLTGRHRDGEEVYDVFGLD